MNLLNEKPENVGYGIAEMFSELQPLSFKLLQFYLAEVGVTEDLADNSQVEYGKWITED